MQSGTAFSLLMGGLSNSQLGRRGKALEPDLYVELVGILSKAHNASSLQQNI